MVERTCFGSQPEISVIVATMPGREFHSYPYLRRQVGVEYEIIVVRDAKLDVCEARTRGVEAARSEFVAVTDDDTRPPCDWLQKALSTVQMPGVHAVEGPVVGEYNIPRLYRTCNLAFTKAAWDAVGQFDSDYAGWLEDTVFGWEIERTFGRNTTQYDPDMEMEHVGPLKSTPIDENERQVKREYRTEFREVLLPDRDDSKKL